MRVSRVYKREHGWRSKVSIARRNNVELCARAAGGSFDDQPAPAHDPGGAGRVRHSGQAY